MFDRRDLCSLVSASKKTTWSVLERSKDEKENTHVYVKASSFFTINDVSCMHGPETFR